MKYALMRIPFAQHFLEKIRLKYVKALVWELNIVEEIPEIETKIPVNIRMATIHDLLRHAYFGRPPLREDDVLKRLSKGDLCFIALWKDIIVGYLWVALRRKVYVPEFEREIVFKDGEGYLYDSFVFPAFRGKGLFKKMHEESFHYLKSRNVESVKGITVTTNEPPQRALRNMGFSPVKLLKFVRISRFKKFEEYKLEKFTPQPRA